MPTPRSKSKRAGRRGRTALPAPLRKQRLIQTRVAEELDATLRQEARKKRVTVSQLIRNVLEDTFHLVGDLMTETVNLTETVKRDARRIAESAQGRTRPPQTYAILPIDRVDAWQEVVLNRTVRCARCDRRLAQGAPAFFGISADSFQPRLWLCPDCHRTPAP